MQNALDTRIAECTFPAVGLARLRSMRWNRTGGMEGRYITYVTLYGQLGARTTAV
jgi:hypothetical protein